MFLIDESLVGNVRWEMSREMTLQRHGTSSGMTGCAPMLDKSEKLTDVLASGDVIDSTCPPSENTLRFSRPCKAMSTSRTASCSRMYFCKRVTT